MSSAQPPGDAGSQSGGAGAPQPKRGWLEIHQTLVSAVIAAIATLAAVVLTVALNNAKQDTDAAEGDAAGLRQQVDALQEQVRTRDDTIASLQDTSEQQVEEIRAKDERIAELEGSTGPGRPTAAPESGAPPIRHQGEVTLAAGGDRIDMNSPSTDPVWGAGTTSTSAQYLSFSTSGLYFNAVDVLRLNPGETATHSTCSTRTGYSGDSYVSVESFDGVEVCARTETGRFAAIRLVDHNDQAVTLAITTWELA